MTFEESWLELVSGRWRGPGVTAARASLALLSGLYGAGLAANLGLYHTGLRHVTQPCLPVISVGNLTVGGTGKSTAVRFLARELLALGLRPGVVLRGHRRQGGPEVLLAADGHGGLAPVEQTGDEAAEVAQALPDVPVAVAKRRELAIEALHKAGAQIALLDDGYQYFRMARDLNIALLNARMVPASAHLLPNGVLREPWSQLRRADQVWITHADKADLSYLEHVIRCYAPAKPLVTTQHAAAELVECATGKSHVLSELMGVSVVAMSGLGCPESFEDSLTGLGALVFPLRFRDHHHYTTADWTTVSRMMSETGAKMLVTTYKDAVKLPPTPPVPVWVLRTELQIVSGQEHVAHSLELLRKKITDGQR